MRSLFIFVMFAVFHSQDMKAQEQVDSSRSGKLSLNQDKLLDSLVSTSSRINAEKQTIMGFRIQIFFGTDRKKATEMRSTFLQKYPSIPANLIYQQPNYKVRVGDFRTRIEAYKIQQQLNQEFPGFIVKDDISLPPLE